MPAKDTSLAEAKKRCGRRTEKFASKISSGYGVVREKAEYEDLAAIARKSGKTIAQIRSEVLKANKQ